jgi:hypothetical protein
MSTESVTSLRCCLCATCLYGYICALYGLYGDVGIKVYERALFVLLVEHLLFGVKMKYF